MVEASNMADQNKSAADKSFYSELLSTSELFAARSRSHKIPARGQKDFFPDDSEEQRQRLEQTLAEHWSLLSEERVERLGNLVKAVWIPDKQMVELQSPAGKFWQTMGFSANGKQCLLPEEALYLMECGNLQVFYRDLPLSIQEGYERFLSSESVSLVQYQVFGHLKRLGYVVHRFDPSWEPSLYERQLNLPQSRDRAGRQQLKRKRSSSPATSHSPTPTSSSCTDTPEGSTAERMPEETGEGSMEVGEGSMEVQPSTSAPPGEGRDGTWWFTDALGASEEGPDPGTSSSSTCRDFSPISFPDLGSSAHPLRCLASPDPSLLPGALSVGECDVAPWRQRINLRKVAMSQNEQRRERQGHGWRRDVNQVKEVRRCRNWAEYQELMRRRQGRRAGRPDNLWNREVAPLHDPTQPIPTKELLDKISVIKSTDLLEGASRLKGSEEWRITFNVYQPDSVADFKKSSPGKPYSRMCVCRFDGPVPDLRVLKQLASQSGDTPVVFAVVDYGDISFYTFKDFQLPTDLQA